MLVPLTVNRSYTEMAPGGSCPTWLNFLDRVSDGDTELVGFLKRICGYALTGSTREHSLAFVHGSGANGKSVFISTIAGILADYHATAPIEAFTVAHGDRHPTDLAGLQGARLVTATETEEGRPWAEARIKALTGGDEISARFMRQDFFNYTPAFKILISGNHQPRIKNIDEAMRRRIHLVPFVVTIPKQERDPNLSEKLKSEWPGILAWAIQGALEWQRGGLHPPKVVTAATDEYLASEDTFERWISDCCELAPNARARSAELWDSWRIWCRDSGEQDGTLRRFVARLTAKVGGNLSPWRDATGRGWQGIQVRPMTDMTDQPI